MPNIIAHEVFFGGGGSSRLFMTYWRKSPNRSRWLIPLLNEFYVKIKEERRDVMQIFTENETPAIQCYL